MFLTIGNETININHISLIIWPTKKVVEASKNPIINWLNESSNDEQKPGYVYIYFNFSISKTGSRIDPTQQIAFCRQVSWEYYEEDLKALAKAVNFDLQKIGKLLNNTSCSNINNVNQFQVLPFVPFGLST